MGAKTGAESVILGRPPQNPIVLLLYLPRIVTRKSIHSF